MNIGTLLLIRFLSLYVGIGEVVFCLALIIVLLDKKTIEYRKLLTMIAVIATFLLLITAAVFIGTFLPFPFPLP